MKLKQLAFVFAAVAGLSTAMAQSYGWDIAPGTIGSGDSAITPGAGTWNTTTGNWTTDSGTNNVAWVNGSAAQFTGSGYTVDLGSGVAVGGITHAGNGSITIKALVDNTVLTVAGSPTWNLNSRTLNLINDGVNDMALAMASGQTLTVTGTGTLNTGEKPVGALWSVGGATLDFQAGVLKGNPSGVGQFGLVKMAGGSTFVHERNNDTGYNNNWELVSGSVKIDNRWDTRVVGLNGVISGAGTLLVDSLGIEKLTLAANNTFTGGIIIDNATVENRVTLSSDGQLGTAPVFDADNITLRNKGQLRLNGVALDPNRGIALDNGGTIIVGGASSASAITGTGGLQIGLEGLAVGNTLTLTGISDYTGETKIYRGVMAIENDDALPTGTVLTIGGFDAGTSALDMKGYNQSITGLQTAGNNTRRVDNTGAAASTLTIDVANGETYSYIGNFGGAGALHLVKTGEGTQRFTKTGAYTTTPASISVENGMLEWKATGSGAVTVGENGTLAGTGTFDGAVTVAGNLRPGTSPGTMSFTDSLTLESTATLTLEFTGTGAGQFDVLANDGDNTLMAGGALVLDATGYTATLGDSFLVFTNWGGFAEGFDSIAGTDLGGGLSFDTSNLLVDGTLSVIPEPGTFGLVLLLGSGIVAMRRVFVA